MSRPNLGTACAVSKHPGQTLLEGHPNDRRVSGQAVGPAGCEDQGKRATASGHLTWAERLEEEKPPKHRRWGHTLGCSATWDVPKPPGTERPLAQPVLPARAKDNAAPALPPPATAELTRWPPEDTPATVLSHRNTTTLTFAARSIKLEGTKQVGARRPNWPSQHVLPGTCAS